MDPELFVLKLEQAIKNTFVGFVVAILSVVIAGAMIFYIALMISFNNIFLSLFLFGLLLIIHYIGKQVRKKINDSELQ